MAEWFRHHPFKMGHARSIRVASTIFHNFRVQVIQTTSQRERRLAVQYRVISAVSVGTKHRHRDPMAGQSDIDESNVPACGLKITSCTYGLGIRGECLGLQIRRGWFDSTRPCNFILTAQNSVLADARRCSFSCCPKTDMGWQRLRAVVQFQWGFA